MYTTIIYEKWGYGEAGAFLGQLYPKVSARCHKFAVPLFLIDGGGSFFDVL